MRAISQEQKDRIVALFDGGMSITDIVSETSVNHVTTRKILAAAGKDLPDKKQRKNDTYYTSPETAARLTGLYAEGRTIKDIAQSEGMTTKTVRAILTRAGAYTPGERQVRAQSAERPPSDQ